MVGAGAVAGEAECDVDSVVEVKQLEGDEGLVVIGGQDGVEMAEGGIAVDAIRHAGAGEAGPGEGGAELLHSGGDDARLLISKGAVFTVVGVEPGHGDVRGGFAAGAAHEICQQGADAHELCGGEQAGHICQGGVYGAEGYGEPLAGEAHGEIRHAQAVCKEFGLPGEVEADSVQVFLADRGGDHGIDAAFFEGCGSVFQLFERGLGGFAGGAAGSGVNRRAHGAEFCLFTGHGCQRGTHDFRADAGLVAQGVADDGTMHGN